MKYNLTNPAPGLQSRAFSIATLVMNKLSRVSVVLFTVLVFVIGWAGEAAAGTVTTRLTGTNNWNDRRSWYQACAGTITYTGASTSVTGVGTNFGGAGDV
jgi:hypothetical protein